MFLCDFQKVKATSLLECRANQCDSKKEDVSHARLIQSRTYKHNHAYQVERKHSIASSVKKEVAWINNKNFNIFFSACYFFLFFCLSLSFCFFDTFAVLLTCTTMQSNSFLGISVQTDWIDDFVFETEKRSESVFGAGRWNWWWCECRLGCLFIWKKVNNCKGERKNISFVKKTRVFNSSSFRKFEICFDFHSLDSWFDWIGYKLEEREKWFEILKKMEINI